MNTKLKSLMSALKQMYKLRLILMGIALIFCSLPLGQSFANNLTIDGGNIFLTEQDTANQTIDVSFELTWYNSWRNEINYDAVWIFVKYSTDSGSTWHHAYLSTTGSDHYTDGGFEIKVGTSTVGANTRGMGVFLQRNAAGTGAVSSQYVKLKWNWGQNGLSADTSARVKVYAIEMVYVPAGSFYLGDGDGDGESPGAFHSGTSNSGVVIGTSLTRDIRVDSGFGDDSQLVNTGIGIGGSGVWAGLDTDDDGSIDNASFPTGYNPFYMMKYEVTEGQWVDFFNSLTATQKSSRDLTGVNGKNSDSVVNRNTISWSSGDAATTRPNRVCNYLSWMDLCAYADWAGLRPMTELEFEKASRGPEAANRGDTVDGTETLIIAYSISGSEDGTETITNSGANVVMSTEGFTGFTGGDAGSGPVRSGIFATANSTRAESGAGYYGNMELAGNVYERSVTVGNSTDRAFEGTNGDGSLTTSGYANNTDWPGYAEGAYNSVYYDPPGNRGFRGNSWESPTSTGFISYRADNPGTGRTSWYGARFVRSAP